MLPILGDSASDNDSLPELVPYISDSDSDSDSDDDEDGLRWTSTGSGVDIIVLNNTEMESGF